MTLGPFENKSNRVVLEKNTTEVDHSPRVEISHCSRMYATRSVIEIHFTSVNMETVLMHGWEAQKRLLIMPAQEIPECSVPSASIALSSEPLYRTGDIPT